MEFDANDRLTRQLAAFRRDHAPAGVVVAGAEWRYVVAGEASRTLLVLPGALGVAELGFQLIDALERDMRIIALSYPPVGSMDEMLVGIEGVLDAEGIDVVDVLGGSFGGTVAQCWARTRTERTHRLILSHTLAPAPQFRRRMNITLGVTRLLPMGIGRALMRRRVGGLLPDDFETRDFWNAFLREIGDGLTRPYFVGVLRCMRDFMADDTLGPGDLAHWEGRILVLESDNDTSVGESERAALRAMYPSARVHTFRGLGHASVILDNEAYVEQVREFLGPR